jgi:hypothetical protein
MTTILAARAPAIGVAHIICRGSEGVQGGVRVLRASQVALTSLISYSNKSGSVGVNLESGYLLVSALVYPDRGTQTSLRELRCEKP